MKIFELFDKPKADVESRPFKGSEEFGVSKTIDGRVIVFKATKEVVAKSFAMIHGLTDQAEWIVQFTDNTVGDSTYDKTGKGNEFKVFQFVMDGLRTFIKEYDPEFISFESKIREPSRVKLYDRMVKRLASDYNVVRKDGAFNSPHNGNSSKEYRLFAKRLKPMGGLHTMNNEDQPTQPASLDELVDYPKIQKTITDMWGEPRLQEYMEHLLADTLDSRGKPRQGFPAKASSALVKLSLAHRRALEKQGINIDDNPSSQFAVTEQWPIPKNF